MREVIRHGDVLLVSVDDDEMQGNVGVPWRKHPGTTRPTALTLALGEVTGHSHVLQAEDGTLEVHSMGDRFSLTKEAQVVHEEHNTVRVPPGNWRIIRQREYWGGAKFGANIGRIVQD